MAFVAAVATSSQLKRQSAAMAAYSVAFAGAAYLFLRVLGLGAQGLVWANCLNMLLRILWNLWFVQGFFVRHGVVSPLVQVRRKGWCLRGWQETFDLRSTLPTAGSVAATAITAAILRREGGAMARGFDGRLLRDVVVAGAFAVVLLVLERKFLLHCYRLMML